MNDISNIQAYVPAVGLTDLLPLLALLFGAILCLIVDAASDKKGSRTLLPVICAATLAATFAIFYADPLPTSPFLESTFRADEFGQLGCMIITFAALVMALISPPMIERRNLPSGEYYALILFATFGMVTLVISNELLTAFIALEILSLSLYVLTGIDRRSAKAAEASFKYFILGSFATAFLVLGIAFLFGATKTTYLSEMAHVFQTSTGSMTEINPLWVYAGFALIFVGICFKLSLAPFHMYAPDVYEGANTPTTMIIATASKVAAFALLVHVVEALSYWPAFSIGATFVIGLVAVTSMVWGNLAALVQSNIKRMLAYSSVAHTGYATVGVLVLAALPGMGLGAEDLEIAQRAVRKAIIFYLAGYTIMNIAAFGIAHYIGGEGQMGAWRGLIHRKPMAAVGMALAMFSLLGIPPTVGFMGKFFIFKEAVQYGFTGIAIVAMLASVASAFYYLSLVVTMFMREEDEVSGVGLAGVRAAAPQLWTGELFARVFLTISCALVIVFGIAPGLFFAWRLVQDAGIGAG
ncbi:NADH-quinone oxidoreductase subunit N [soil metagenome]